VLLEQRVSTTPKAMKEVFGGMPRSRIALETGMHSPWVSRLLSALGHEVIVAHARNVRLIGESRRKDDRLDAQTLARLARIDPQLLCPVKHRSAGAQADLTVIRARAGLVRARTALGNTARGLAKSYGERLRGCNVRNMNPEKAEGLSPKLQIALEPLLAAIESLSERIRECNERIEKLAQDSYPQVAVLKQVKGVGTLIALTFLLTLEDAHRFRKSRDVGCYLGLQPGRRNSGQSEPQMHISKEGDPYLRTLLVQGAQHILGPFGTDSDLRRWGLKLAQINRADIVSRGRINCCRVMAVAIKGEDVLGRGVVNDAVGVRRSLRLTHHLQRLEIEYDRLALRAVTDEAASHFGYHCHTVAQLQFFPSSSPVSAFTTSTSLPCDRYRRRESGSKVM